MVADREEGLDDFLQSEELHFENSQLIHSDIGSGEHNAAEQPTSGLSYLWILPSASKSHMLVVLISATITTSCSGGKQEGM